MKPKRKFRLLFVLWSKCICALFCVCCFVFSFVWSKDEINFSNTFFNLTPLMLEKPISIVEGFSMIGRILGWPRMVPFFVAVVVIVVVVVCLL